MKISPTSINYFQLAEGIDEAQLEALLQRIASRIYGKESSFDPLTMLTNKEFGKALEMIPENEGNEEERGKTVSQYIQACIYIFKEAARVSLAANELETELKEAEISSTQIQAMVKTWDIEGSKLIQRSRNIVFGMPSYADDVKWQCNVQVLNPKEGPNAKPSAKAIMQLALSSSETASQDNVLIELDREQISKLVKDVEIIQTQLDALSS